MKRKIVQFIVGLILSAVAAKITTLILGDDKEPKKAE